MTIPNVPLPVLTGLLFIAVLVESPFNAARSALIADVLPDDRYVLANALGNITNQTGQVVGFAAGGLAVEAIGARNALLLDVGTFLVSALILLIGTRPRPAVAPSNGHGGFGDWWGRISAGARLVFGDAQLRTLLLLSWLATFYVIPEGMAAQYGSQLHANRFGIGLLFAAQPAGVVVGGLVLSRMIRPARRIALLVPLAALACGPMIALGLHPNLGISLALLALGGAGASYQLVANATYVQSVTPSRRGQAYGLAAAGLTAGQGLGIFGAGAIAGAFGLQPSTVIAGAGVIGLLAVVAISGAGRALVASPLARGALNPRS
jgi:MFS family permease